MVYTILYESVDLLAVDKPIGISTIPERNKDTPCLQHELSEQVGVKLMPVHRLDKDVSGIVVFAKHPDAHRRLNMKFDRKEIAKSYLAVVHGKMEKKKGEIDIPIRQFGSGRMGVDEQRGKRSMTRFAVEQRNEQFSKVQLFPLTGRRHQLRVHLYSIGHPIVGDTLYGDRTIQSRFSRLFLHASLIEFEWDPGQMVRIESIIPEHFDPILAGHFQ